MEGEAGEAGGKGERELADAWLTEVAPETSGGKDSGDGKQGQ
jgi:hypothetical protein